MSTNLTISFDNNQIEETLQHFVLKQQDIPAISTTTNNGNPTPKTNMDMPKLLSIEEMCKLFKVSRVTINTWMKQGKIPFIKMSRRVYFVFEDVMNAIPNNDLSIVENVQLSRRIK